MAIDPIIPFGEWKPDSAPYDQGNKLVDVKNAVPKGSHYESFKSLSAKSLRNLPAEPKGAISFKNFNNSTKTYVGTANALYSFNNIDFIEVSRAGGYSGNNLISWEFAQFNDILITTNFYDEVQTKDLSLSGNFTSLNGNPPRAKHIGKIGQFIILGNLSDSSGEFNNKIQWCGINNVTDWSNNPDNQAGSQFFNQTGGGEITKIISGSQYGFVFQENAISRIAYVGAPIIFRIDTLEKNRGTKIPTSVYQKGKLVYYIGKDGFFVFDGSQSMPIGENKIDKFFFNDVDLSNTHKISVGSQQELIFWSYPSKEGNGECDKIIVYNEFNNSWSKLDIKTNLLHSSLSHDVGLEELDNIYGTIDKVDLSFDSPAFIGGHPLFCGFNENNQLCTFDGETLTAEFITKEFQYERGKVTRLQKIAPIITGDSKLQVGIRDKLNEEVTFQPDITQNSAGYFATISTAAFHRLKLITQGEFKEANGLQILEATIQGNR